MRALPTFLDDALNHRFLVQLLATPKGRATMLNQLADAEGGDGGELDIFEHLLAVLDDPEAQRLARTHKADEERHERLFAEAARREGVAPHVLPKESQLLRRLDAHTGFFTRSITDRDGVVEAYVLLLVIEERALRQFKKMRRAFAAVGRADLVALLDEVSADEERHLRYCDAVTRRYAPDEAVRQQRITAMRELEAQCFDEVQAMNLRALSAAGALGEGPWGVVWRALASLARDRVQPLPAVAHA